MKHFRTSILLILSLIFSVLCFTGCGTDEELQYPWTITESEQRIQNEDENITLQIDENSITTQGARITLQNSSSAAVSFGKEYFIQLLKDNAWYDIEAVADWTLELIEIQPNQKYEENLDWSSYYGELPSGTYRIVKKYDKSDVSSYVFCQFEIE